MAQTAGKGVAEVVNRCEAAKQSHELDLTACDLLVVPEAVCFLLRDYSGQITSCNLSHNKLKKFPTKLSVLTELRNLNLSYNSLTASSFEHLDMHLPLETMDISYNQITAVNFELLEKQFPALRQVNLTGNTIDDNCIRRLTNDHQVQFIL